MHLLIQNLVVNHADIKTPQCIVKFNSAAQLVLTINADGRAERHAHSCIAWASDLNGGALSIVDEFFSAQPLRRKNTPATQARKARAWISISPVLESGLGSYIVAKRRQAVSARANQGGIHPDTIRNWSFEHWRQDRK